VSEIDDLQLNERIKRYRERARLRAAYAETLQDHESRSIEAVIANAWRALADYLESHGSSSQPSSRQAIGPAVGDAGPIIPCLSSGALSSVGAYH
jgi:hypothetical protein